MSRWQDSDLRRYLAGEMGADDMAALEANLGQDTALEDRLMALDPLAGVVAEAFAGLPGAVDLEAAENAVAAAAPPVVAAPEARRPRLALVASLALGRDLDIAALQAAPDLDLKRAQILGFEGRPLVQIAFANDAGEAIALCIIRRDETDRTGIAMETRRDLASASWARGAHEFLIIGGSDNGEIREWAERFAETI